MCKRYLYLLLLVSALVLPLQAQDPEAAGQAAEQAGQLDEALQQYVAALKALPDPPPVEADLRLRERIVRLVLKSGTRLPVPPEAEQRFRKGQSLLEAHKAFAGSGDTGGLEAAAAELRQAVRMAPWWPEATLALAETDQKLQRYEAAAGNLALQRLMVQEAKAPAAAPAPEAQPAEAAPATVYVYWPRKVDKVGFRNRLDCDGLRVAKLQSGRHVVLRLTPGLHTIKFGQGPPLELEAGHEYFLRVCAEGLFRASNSLRLVAREEAIAEMRKGKITPADPDHVFDPECKVGDAQPDKRK
jgi:tetratricopeptide (TPR) repeat protein